MEFFVSKRSDEDPGWLSSPGSPWSVILLYLRYPVSLSHEKVNQLMCQHLVSSLTNLKFEQYPETVLKLIVDLLLTQGVGKLVTFTFFYLEHAFHKHQPKGHPS